MNLDSFTKILDTNCPDQPICRQQAGEAHRNLSGFMSLLIKINEREQIIQTKPARKPLHENK